MGEGPGRAAGVTLEEWADRNGRVVGTVYNARSKHPDFPDPIGCRPRPGGARGTPHDLYDEAALDAWLAAHPRRLPPAIAFDGDPDELLTLSAIARRSRHADTDRRVDGKTVYQYRDRPGFPEPASGTPYRLYRAGDVVDWLSNNRPGSGNWGRGQRPGGRPRTGRATGAGPAPAGPGTP